MEASLVTLEDLGWIPCWDRDGRYPIKDTESLKIVPTETIEIFWVCRPKQESDGKWYGNAIIMYEPFPSLIGGTYQVNDILVDATLCGKEESPSMTGKIEEFAYWAKDIGFSGLQNYHINLTGMIGGDDGDRYGSISAAKNGGLKYYYSFSNSSVLIKNFSGDGAPSIKSTSMEISSGKHANSTVLKRDSYIKLEAMNLNDEFTMNFRFLLDKNEDFVLFDNPEALTISYDASNGVFKIDFIPYIGNKKSYFLEVPNMKVHTWYDMGILFSGGKLTLVINGEELESFSPSVNIGGTKKTSLDMTNFSKISIDAGSGLGIIPYGYTSTYTKPGLSNLRVPTKDGETYNLAKDIYYSNFDYTVNGGKNAMDLLLDKTSQRVAGLSVNTFYRHYSPTIEEKDAITTDSKISFVAGGNTSSGLTGIRWSIEEENSSISIFARLTLYSEGYQAKEAAYGYSSNATNLSILPNTLTPEQEIRMTLKVTDLIIEQSNIFPKLFIFPGTRVKVLKREMISPTKENEFRDLVSLGEAGHLTPYGSTHIPVLSPNIHSVLFRTSSAAIPHIVANGQRAAVYQNNADLNVNPRYHYAGSYSGTPSIYRVQKATKW